MKEERIFIGNIRKCTCYTERNLKINENTELNYILRKHEMYKEDAVLLKTNNGYYADLEGLSIRDMALLYSASIGDLLPSRSCYKDQLYVDESSLKSYEKTRFKTKKNHG